MTEIYPVFPLPFVLPPGSPPLYKDGNGILSSHRFITLRAEYLAEGISKSPSGQFSSWYGSNHLVVLSGEVARTSFLTARGLDPTAGFVALLGGFLDISEVDKDNTRRAFQIYKRCAQIDHMTSILPRLVSDSDSHMRALGLTANEKGRAAIISPQKFLGLLSYQLTHRASGVHDIVNDPVLLRETWNVYTPLEDSPYIDIMLPWLPTPSKLRKVWGYAKLHLTVTKIARERKAEGRTEEDMLQMMIEADLGSKMQSVAVIGAVLAGVFNTTFSTVYNICCLANEPEWLAKVRTEIENVLERRRKVAENASEPLVDTLQRLSVRDWETCFPILRAAITESIRFTMAGSVVRKNIGAKDLEIGVGGLVVPAGSLAIHATADTHMNQAIYPEPLKWDSSRFLGDKHQGDDVPHGYLGWESGNHPCPARRLNVIVASVLFVAHYDFHVCDRVGNRKAGPLPPIIYNRQGAGQLKTNVYLKCQSRI
ncbi:cytochrome P450 [Microdochium trichocladiopsis]|uniref:Cytochrome P450 n=1 Tax=Microdochium trichocladiopsis TaxID=1682393 RepID=A0A9P9BRF4_9PEZI|nr:cytochrome P450 [Microdochium trichocladiopsis]KAH7032668.1 cytochrome P450 [Microdochium trichocladiopsis]